MALSGSGEISIGGTTTGRSINLEFGRAATAQTSMLELYRGGSVVPNASVNSNIPAQAGAGTVPISLSQFYGATRRVSFTVPVPSQQNYVADTSKVTGYVAGVSDVEFIVTGNIGSTSTSTYAFDVDTSWNSGDTIKVTVNPGVYISGAGGKGGLGPYYAYPYIQLIDGHEAGWNAGSALRARTNISITNNGVIQSGGGGGASSPYNAVATTVYVPGNKNTPPYYQPVTGYVNGSGGGGGGGLTAGAAGGRYPAAQPFSSEHGNDTYSQGGSAGTLTAGGAGGASVLGGTYSVPTIKGGDGGAPGSAGQGTSDRAGGSGGYATVKSAGVTITWLTTGTRYGGIDATI